MIPVPLLAVTVMPYVPAGVKLDVAIVRIEKAEAPGVRAGIAPRLGLRSVPPGETTSVKLGVPV